MQPVLPRQRGLAVTLYGIHTIPEPWRKAYALGFCSLPGINGWVDDKLAYILGNFTATLLSKPNRNTDVEGKKKNPIIHHDNFPCIIVVKSGDLCCTEAVLELTSTVKGNGGR